MNLPPGQNKSSEGRVEGDERPKGPVDARPKGPVFISKPAVNISRSDSVRPAYRRYELS